MGPNGAYGVVLPSSDTAGSVPIIVCTFLRLCLIFLPNVSPKDLYLVLCHNQCISFVAIESVPLLRLVTNL